MAKVFLYGLLCIYRGLFPVCIMFYGYFAHDTDFFYHKQNIVAM